MVTLREILAESKTQEGKYLAVVSDIIDSEKALFSGNATITARNSIPDTSTIPLDNPSNWLKIPGVICCFVDMAGSTKMSAELHPNSTAKTYRYFTSTALNIFHEFEAPYIDIKGDGVFALFDIDKPHLALAATVSFKSFVKEHFTPDLKAKHKLDIGGHFGIDQGPVLVRRLGKRRIAGRTDRQNEVWAGTPVNMAAKLGSRSDNSKLWVSDRFFKLLKHSGALNSCGCNSDDGKSKPLWTPVDLKDDPLFDFDVGYTLESNWCEIHGKGVCKAISQADP